MRWKTKAIKWIRLRDKKKVLSDANQIGFDALRAGLLTFLVSLFIPIQVGKIGALTFVLVGLIVWVITLPRGDDDG